MPVTSRTFLSQIAIFSQFLVYLNVYYFLIISILWYHTDEFKRNRRIIVYGSVTRYGPQTSCQRKGLKLRRLWIRLSFSFFFLFFLNVNEWKSKSKKEEENCRNFNACEKRWKIFFAFKIPPRSWRLKLSFVHLLRDFLFSRSSSSSRYLQVLQRVAEHFCQLTSAYISAVYL